MRYLALWLGVLAVGCQASEGLSTVSQEAVVLSPGSHDFGTVQVGDATLPFTLNVNPAFGANDDSVTQITASCPDFAIDAPGLPAQVYRVCDTAPCFTGSCVPQLACTTIDYQNYSFTALFRPTVAGAVSCVVTIQLNGATNRTVTLTGTGSLPPVAVEVAPKAIDFGEVRRDTTSGALGVGIRDAGGQALMVSSVAVSAGFAIASGPTGDFVVAPGDTQSLALTCHPTAVGALSGALTFTTNDPANPSLNIPLTCTGVDSAMSLAPSPAMFSPTRVGEPQTLTIDIGNTGAAPMSLESVAISGAGFALSPVGAQQIPAGGSVTATLTFDAATAGDATGALVAAYDGGQQHTAQISARALATSMALTPDGDVDFGPVCAGQSKAQTFSILANASGSFTVASVSSPAAPFGLSAPTLPALIAGSGATTLMFTVTAAPLAAGHAMSSFTVTTDIPAGAPHTINLAVDALTAGVSPTPEVLDFGSQPIQTTTLGQTVRVSNCSGADLAWSNPRIEGPDAGDFAIVSAPASATIPSTGFASWLIVLQAHSVGPKAATFVVDYTGGSATTMLAGEGLGDTTGPTPSGGTAETSYYACATGRATGSLPLLLALGLVVVRRRRRAAR